MKFHISPRTGEPRLCQARLNCPYGGPLDHYATKEEARAAYELAIAENSKPRVTRTGEAGENNLYAGLEQGAVPLDGGHCDIAYFSERDFDELLSDWQRPSRTTPVTYDADERRAIMRYQSTPAYERIGEALRKGLELGQDEETHAHLVKAFKKASTNQPLTLFRGLCGKHAAVLSLLEVGEYSDELGFASTSPSEKMALGFAETGLSKHRVLLQLETPAGTPAIDLGADLYSMEEDEILLSSYRGEVIDKQNEVLDGTLITRIVIRLP